VPAGGAAGDVLVKIDTVDYNTQWASDINYVAATPVNWADPPGAPATIRDAIDRIVAALASQTPPINP
jgi:hypothetical protein